MEVLELLVVRNDFPDLVKLLTVLRDGESDRLSDGFRILMYPCIEQLTITLYPMDTRYQAKELRWITFLFKELGQMESDGRTRITKDCFTLKVPKLGLVQWKRGQNKTGKLGSWLTIEIDDKPIVTCDPLKQPDIQIKKMFFEYLRKHAEEGFEVAKELLDFEKAEASFTYPFWHTCPKDSYKLGRLLKNECVD